MTQILRYAQDDNLFHYPTERQFHNNVLALIIKYLNNKTQIPSKKTFPIHFIFCTFAPVKTIGVP